jgi:hypothetical protein
MQREAPSGCSAAWPVPTVRLCDATRLQKLWKGSGFPCSSHTHTHTHTHTHARTHTHTLSLSLMQVALRPSTRARHSQADLGDPPLVGVGGEERWRERREGGRRKKRGEREGGRGGERERGRKRPEPPRSTRRRSSLPLFQVAPSAALQTAPTGRLRPPSPPSPPSRAPQASTQSQPAFRVNQLAVSIRILGLGRLESWVLGLTSWVLAVRA